MRDQFSREIDYIRFSITDRCNLRCRYCMPQGVPLGCHQDLLSFEEFLEVARAAVELGITRFKVTGGEPLVRRGCLNFLRRLKSLPGVEQVTLTTNGALLAPLVPDLAGIGLDGVNISLDDPTPEGFRAITGFDLLPQVLEGLSTCVAAGLKTKLNCVLLPGCEGRLPAMAAFAQGQPVDVRFIEVMPIGEGARHPGPTREQALAILRQRWPDLHPVEETRGNGPAHYYASTGLTGRIGMIDAVSHKFCAECNRVRLTSTGMLKPCLCYGEGTDLRAVLRGSAPGELKQVLAAAIWNKPQAHCFDSGTRITEHKNMSEIGG